MQFTPEDPIALDMQLLDFDDAVLRLPPDIQKDYPTDNSSSYTRIGLADETVRTLRTSLATRWKDTDARFPSRQSDRMTTESVRNVVRDAAITADTRPYTIRNRGKPADVTSHTLRHSVAYRILAYEEGNTLYDVANRLRHATIQTTERESTRILTRYEYRPSLPMKLSTFCSETTC